MKIDNIIVDLAVVAMVVLPYVIFIMTGRGEFFKLKNKFLQETAKHLGNTAEIHSWNGVMTALDRTLQKMVLVQRTKEGFRTEVIDLTKFKSCQINTEYSDLVVDKKPSTILKKIDLEFTDLFGKKSYVNLYDHSVTYREEYELRNAEKLNELIKNCLSSRPFINSAA